MAGRKRKGTLVNYGGTWKARVANGPLIELGTKDRTLAERKLANLTGRDPGITDPLLETFQPASERVVDMLAAAGMLTARDRLARLRKFAWPTIGDVAIGKVTPRHITDILVAAAATGIAHDTLEHLRVDLSKVFGELIRDEILTANPADAKRIRMPKVARDRRKRVLLTDAEFGVFVEHHLAAPVAAPVPRRRYSRAAPQKVTRRQLALMALVTRCFGGMRPSDLHSWTWSDVDLSGAWQWADVPRPKTEHLAETTGATAAPRERLALPEVLIVHLRAWWESAGQPAAGLVFPLHQHSYARPLRRALLEAGLSRPELHHDTDTTRATDFYSFRRAWASALAGAGTIMQDAMRLTGHKNASTHARYDVRPVLVIPAGALPASLGRNRASLAADARADAAAASARSADATVDAAAATASTANERATSASAVAISADRFALDAAAAFEAALENFDPDIDSVALVSGDPLSTRDPNEI